MDQVRLSEKSTIDEEKSTSDEEKSTADEEKSGMKRKIDEEDDEDDSEDESEDESESEEEEENDNEEEEENKLLIDGEYYSNADLIDSMWHKDELDDDQVNNHKFFNKMRRYLKSIHDSHGFEITDWPGGHIWGITTFEPRSKQIIEKRDRCPESYKYIMFLARHAVTGYNKDNQTNYKVDHINQVNSTTAQGYTYYITFIAYEMNVNQKYPFQAKVWDNIPGQYIKVISCNPKSE